MTRIKNISTCGLLALAMLVPACGDDGEDGVDEDLGAVDDPETGMVTFADRINWPGIDHADGRQVPFIRGFGEGGPAAYWFLGFAARRTADSFWFCREGDTQCPLDENQRLNWDHLVGNPVFTRLPGQEGFSPFWQMWRVTVPEEYQPNDVKSKDTLDKLQKDGVVTVEPFIMTFDDIFGENLGPKPVLLHCALVLTDTTLAENGELMPDGETPMEAIPMHHGWHQKYRVQFADFSVSDGVFAEADDSTNRPLMRKANIYIQWRDCDADPMPEICNIDTNSVGERPVSERGLGQDITGDGDDNDTNNTVGGIPCKKPLHPEELVYSPLWAVNKVKVLTPTMGLIDTYEDQRTSDIQSVVEMFEDVDSGLLAEPEPQTEDSSGNPVPGNDGQIFFNCPNPVKKGFVPYPCSANDL